MVQLPAAWALAGVTVALFGLRSRLALGGWAPLAVFVFLWLVGAFLQLNRWVLHVSPFSHIPKVPGAEMTVAPLVWLVAITTALVLVGFAGFRRRDVGGA